MATYSKDRKDWAVWAANYGLEKLFDSFMRSVQGAQSHCIHCGMIIECDIREGGGVPDWKTQDGDYGCSRSPDTNEEGTGGHTPRGVI